MMPRPHTRWRNLAAAFLFLVAYCSVARAQAPYPRTWTSWIGPMPFTSGATVRSDFHNIWDVPSTWGQIKTQTEVFKTYLNVLQNPAWGQGGLTDAQVAGFVGATSGKQMAFETSGLRNYGGDWCDSSLGQKTWNMYDYPFLQRWRNAGGRIDYITTDHAISGNHFDDPDSPNNCHYMSIHDLNAALLDYFALAKKAFPGVKVGLIESLGFWKFVTPSRTYNPTRNLTTSNGVPALVRLTSVLNDLYSQASQRGIAIDHFDVDFGMEGVEFDGDYGRILATESIVHGLGWKIGIIGNAWARNCITDANTCARDRTINFFTGYFKTTGNPDKLVFQQWQPNPAALGNDSNGNYTTSLGLIYASIFHWAAPGWLPVGEYRVLPGSTIIKVTSSSTYCQWASWNDYLAAHGGNGDLSWMTGYGSRPRSMTNTGAC
jgi:hypothetical protein